MTLGEKGVMQVDFDEESRQYVTQWPLVLEGGNFLYFKSNDSEDAACTHDSTVQSFIVDFDIDVKAAPPTG